MEIENNTCQHVLHLIDTFKDTPLVQMIQIFISSFPITLDEYPILCTDLVSYPIRFMAILWIHMAGEELKKRLPYHVSKIEQERVKYLMTIRSLQRVTFNLDCNRVYPRRSEKCLDADSRRSISTPDPILREQF
jgi:hypothetical protein